MIPRKAYFFCGIGGSGMLPLALIVQAGGAEVAGSDRALDQGRTAAKFDFLLTRGVALFAQDGSGVTSGDQLLVASGAIEETVPDIQAARRVGAGVTSRAELLAELFNAAPISVGVAGTSGKSTVTGMIGLIAQRAGLDPTVMNGAEMKNFATDETPFASALVGQGPVFVSEVDESDGSIARYTPSIAVINNISLDHKSMEELRSLFTGFAAKAQSVALNLDNPETAALAAQTPGERLRSYSLSNPEADLVAEDIELAPASVSFRVRTKGGETVGVQLNAPGLHNVSNALAALSAAGALGVPLNRAADALSEFTGIKRRMDVVGTAGGVTVIDDFAHNPDKIEATLSTLHAFPGRLLVMFQPHGYGPLKLMREAFIEGFAEGLKPDDVLIMPDPVYYGGTTDRGVGSADIADGVRVRGRTALAFADRASCGDELIALARPGDRIIVMGARDDTLSQFAAELLIRLGMSAGSPRR